MITEAANRLNPVSPLLIGAKFASQVADVHIDTAIMRHRLPAKGRDVELPFVNHLSPVLQQGLQDAEFGAGQFHILAIFLNERLPGLSSRSST